MSITAYSTIRNGNVTLVTVTSSLVGLVFFHWYQDGAYVGMTTSPSRSFFVPAGEQARIEVLDTLDPGFDPIANAPAGYPPKRTIWWLRSQSADAASYRIEQSQYGGLWTAIATVLHQPGQWTYQVLAPRLEDLAYYQWRIVSIDTIGNEGTAAVGIPRRIVRAPDAPPFALTYNPGTQRVTLSAA